MTEQPPPGQPGPYPGQPTPQGQPSYPYPQGAYYQQQPPKKRKKWPWVLLAIVVLFIAGIAGCTALVGGAINSVDKESKTVVQVTYEITGDGPTGSATYTTGNLNTAQDTNIAFPWSKQVDITGLGKTVSLLASNDIDSQGTITCTIKRGAAVISTNTSSGAGATASCSGNAGND